uniref:Uncharacterized protein n=1 Tax=Parascaris univalens TaxID=6257 RepID=A0A915CDZ8_PARUN
YTTRFEMIHIAESNIRSVDDVYEMFFAQTVLDELLSERDLHSDKRLRKIGSHVSGGKKVTTEELLALFEVNELIFNDKIRRDSCSREFAEICKVDKSRVTWEWLQNLSDKYGCDGGRWILTPIRCNDNETTKQNNDWIGLQLLRSFLNGELSKEKFIKGIIFRSRFLRGMENRRTVFCIVNASTTFSGSQNTKNVCIQDFQSIFQD